MSGSVDRELAAMLGEAPKSNHKRRPKRDYIEPDANTPTAGDVVRTLAPASDPGVEAATDELSELIEAMAGLDRREMLFIRSYARHGNERQAAREAGYGRSNNHPLARNQTLRRAVQAVQAVIRKKAAFGVVEAIKELDGLIAESRRKDQMMAAVRASETKLRVTGLLQPETAPSAVFNLNISGIDEPRVVEAEFQREG